MSVLRIMVRWYVWWVRSALYWYSLPLARLWSELEDRVLGWPKPRRFEVYRTHHSGDVFAGMPSVAELELQQVRIRASIDVKEAQRALNEAMRKAG